MKEMICIVCPRGCHLTVGDAPDFSVAGNACNRGAVYGREEAVSPKRVVTATCPVSAGGSEPASAVPGHPEVPQRVPVRTTGAIPKERVAELVGVLMRTRVDLPLRLGDVVLENWEGTGVSVVVTRSIG